MIWNNDYETISAYRNMSDEIEIDGLETALNYARDNLTDGHEKDEDEFIVIRVEGYNCIALVTNEFTPIEICTRVFPFDNEGHFRSKSSSKLSNLSDINNSRSRILLLCSDQIRQFTQKPRGRKRPRGSR